MKFGLILPRERPTAAISKKKQSRDRQDHEVDDHEREKCRMGAVKFPTERASDSRRGK